MSEETRYYSVALHKHVEFQLGCVGVLCEEWGRSTTARVSMLEKSNDSLPYCIALVERSVKGVQVVGHSRLCRVHAVNHAAFIESVVVKKDCRGQGLGRTLMEETEKHAQCLGLTRLYLTTHDKQDFYKHLGYSPCSPILSFGSASTLLADKKFSRLLSSISMKPSPNCNTCKPLKDKNCLAQAIPLSPELCPPPCIPPPPLCIPPPPPCIQPNQNTELNTFTRINWFKKDLLALADTSCKSTVMQ